MTLEDLSRMAFFTVVPPLALVLIALTVIVIARVPRGRREGFVVCAAVFTAVSLAGVFIVVWMREVGFDYTDANKSVPEAIDRSMVFGLFVAGASYAGILATGILAARRRNRLRT